MQAAEGAQLIKASVVNVPQKRSYNVVHGLLQSTEMGERVDPRLRELASRGRRKLGGGIHAT